MKSRKGFTLIELLAIIVILAVIAVITVPIILNIIENARRGAVQNSALGYKDAVHKYYVSRLSLDSNFQMADDIYEIVGNGYLSSGTNNYEVQIDGKVPSNGFVQVEKNVVINACIGYDNYAILISNGNISDTSKGVCLDIDEIAAPGSAPAPTVIDFDVVTSNDVSNHMYTIGKTGYYKVETWGAQGQNSEDGVAGGKGAYASGVIQFTKGQNIYVYVGSQSGYNGGGGKGDSGSPGGKGGGATDIRVLSSGESSVTLNSRIMVAAGGGGSYNWSGYNNAGGAGGTLTGLAGAYYSTCQSTGGSQTSGGSCSWNSSVNGSFGVGGTGTSWGAGGGGGFYGGAGRYDSSASSSGGGGGSSYVSGYTGCVAIASSTSTSPRTANNVTCTIGTTDPDCSIHYSELFFYDPVMIAGNASMPTYDDNESMTGNSGDGHARLTYLGRGYTPQS